MSHYDASERAAKYRAENGIQSDWEIRLHKTVKNNLPLVRHNHDDMPRLKQPSTNATIYGKPDEVTKSKSPAQRRRERKDNQRKRAIAALHALQLENAELQQWIATRQ